MHIMSILKFGLPEQGLHGTQKYIVNHKNEIIFKFFCELKFMSKVMVEKQSPNGQTKAIRIGYFVQRKQ